MTSVLSGNDQPLSLIFLLKGLVEYLISSRIDPPGVANIADTDEDGYPAMNEPYVTPLTKSGFFSALDDLPPSYILRKQSLVLRLALARSP